MDTGLADCARVIAEARLSELPRRWAHVQGVAATMKLLTADSDVRELRDALVASAWLHDVGYADSLQQTGFHPVDGARFLRSMGWPELVVSLVAYHTGAVFEAAERSLSMELEQFSPPPTAVLDLLTCADMMTGPDGAPLDPAERIGEILSRYPADSPVHRAVTRSAPDLLAAVARVKHQAADCDTP